MYMKSINCRFFLTAVLVSGLVLGSSEAQAQPQPQAQNANEFQADASISLFDGFKAINILIYADESQISRILINLVKNALQAGATSITISASIDRSESVLIDVAHNGTLDLTRSDSVSTVFTLTFR